MYDLIIIGGGPAGAAAGVYAARKKLNTLLIAESFGGQSTVSDSVENWIGTIKVSGFELAKMLEDHLRAQEGIEIKMPEKVSSVKSVDSVYEVTTDKGIYQAKTLIVASGGRRRRLGIPGEDKFDGKGVAYCSTCLPPYEAIVANSSLRDITEIQGAQMVLTHDGSYQKVTEIMERDYTGELIEIKTRFFSEPTQLTINHPVLTTTITKGSGPNYWRDFKINKPDWARADQLSKLNVLLYPRVTTTQAVENFFLSDLINVRVAGNMAETSRMSPTAIRIPNEIPISSGFLRLCGYFIAEGSITDKGINFYFSKKEKEYITDVSNIITEIFCIKTHCRIENNVARIEVYSEIIRDLFNVLFGKYAHNKKVPHWMLFLPENQLGELIKGIYRGDGCKRNKDFCIVTNSRVLTYQLRDILLKLGIIPSIQRRSIEQLNKNLGKIDGRIIRFNHDKYHIVVGGCSLEKMSDILGIRHQKIDSRNRTCQFAWLDEGYAYLPIRSIKRKYYQGKVYNLAVEKNNTYVTKNFIVHNCDAPLFKDKAVAVVGGGNAGLEAVVDLLPYAKYIYLLNRGPELTGDPLTQEEIKKSAKVMIINNAQTQEITGDKFVSGLTYLDSSGSQIKALEVQGVFVEIGSIPNSEFMKDIVEMNKFGEIIINHKTAETSKPGIFAAGDVTDEIYKQNNISAGDAVRAALSAYNYLLNIKKQSPAHENS